MGAKDDINFIKNNEQASKMEKLAVANDMAQEYIPVGNARHIRDIPGGEKVAQAAGLAYGGKLGQVAVKIGIKQDEMMENHANNIRAKYVPEPDATQLDATQLGSPPKLDTFGETDFDAPIQIGGESNKLTHQHDELM